MAANQAIEPFSTNSKRRKWVIGISTVGAIAGNLVSLLQHKVIETPTKPSVLGVAAQEAVEATNAKIDMPDALINLINYGLTAWLARAGGKKRAKNQPFLPIAMGVKTIADSAVALEMAREDWEKNHKIGTYPQIAAFASLSAAAVAVPEMVTGVQQLFKK